MYYSPLILNRVAKEKPDPAATPDAAPPKPRRALGTGLIVPLLNSIALLAALGFFIYSKILFKRAPITETTERERLRALHAQPAPNPTPAYITFEPLTINIKANPDQPLPVDGTSQQMSGKLHFVTLSFSIQIRDAGQEEFIKALTPLILDRLILILGKKYFHELTTAQGRYILHSQFLDQINQAIIPLLSLPTKEALITDIFFTQFIVQ